MDPTRAFETLGLSPGASADEIDRAHTQLADEIDARVARASTFALRQRYAEARAELDVARRMARATFESDDAVTSLSDEDPKRRAWAVLGLEPGASPLDVASAYVALCEELERDLATAPTNALRRRCLDARAEVDEAYQLCSAAPLAEEARRASAGSRAGDGAGYETQVATEAFEAPAEEDPELEPIEVMPSGYTVEPDGEESAAEMPAAVLALREPRRPRRRLGRALATLFALAVLVAGGAAGYAWWTDLDVVQIAWRYLPRGLDPDLVRAQTAAAYLRQRIFEERQHMEARAAETRERVAKLEATAPPAAADGRERLEAELTEARDRATLANDLAALAERHVFSGSALAEAVGKFDLGLELVSSGDLDQARGAFEEAIEGLNLSLRELDTAEEAIGARSEATGARDAWQALAASAGLPESEEVQTGDGVLAGAEARLDAGEFREAVPELRRASHHYLVALKEGRKTVSAVRIAEREARAKAEAQVEAEREARAQAEALAASERRARAKVEARAMAEAQARAAAQARPEADARSGAAAGGPSPVAAAPPGGAAGRAAIKLVTVPAGEFLFGCNEDVDVECLEDEKPGRELTIDAFRIDRTEVRVNEYRECVREGRCTAPGSGEWCNWDVAGRGDHPVNCVDFGQAEAYCAWVGKRLPSEREWEKAARGSDGRKYPWGDEEPGCDRAAIAAGGGDGCGRLSTWPVASFEKGRSPYGLFDMVGNVLEWTRDRHESDDGTRVLRGGSWRSFGGPLRVSHRDRVLPATSDGRIGFRCAQDASRLADSKAP